MRAVCWYGKGDVRVEDVPEPSIQEPTDAIVQITSTAICGSDLHLYNGYMPTMKKGDVLGHENMGIVVDVGKSVTRLKVGDRVVIPFNIACGDCFFCRKQMFSLCDVSNPNAEEAKKVMGHSPSGLFGYSHLLGGFPGGQAEFIRVPYADVGPMILPEDIPDDKLLFLSDIFPTGYMAAENCGIEDGDTVAIWGCGPVGQFAIKSCWMLRAGRIIAIDNVPERLALAKVSGAEVINFDEVDIHETLMELTEGRGPDRCIDAVGCEAHAGGTLDGMVDSVKTSLMLATDRPHVLRQAIYACRKGGTISIPGVYIGFGDKIPIGAAMNKGLTIKQGQTHTHKYMPMLLEKVQAGVIDPSFLITHEVPLNDAPQAYEMFKNHDDGCIKVVLKP
jgi:threonine dehydrogenase-like Zn-dependent dehydrogenase